MSRISDYQRVFLALNEISFIAVIQRQLSWSQYLDQKKISSLHNIRYNFSIKELKFNVGLRRMVKDS